MATMIRKLLIYILFSVCLAVSAFATDEPQEIKVGYVSNYGILKAAFSEGSEGYGYEYLTNLINYMEGDYTLTFVSCESWQDGLDKLDCGEIDILGPTTMSEHSDYLYTTNDFGHCTFMLAELSSSSIAPINTTSLDGSTIAIPDYYTDYSCLTDFLEAEGIDATLISIPSSNLNLSLGLEDIDYVWMSSLQTHSGLTIVTGLDSYWVYFIANPNQQALIDEMDRGLVALKEAEPYFQSQLALSYSSYNYTTNAYISEANLALVQEKGVYCVGVRNFYSPLIRTGEDGELEGAAFTLLEILAEKANISFEYVMLDDAATQADFDSADFVIAATDSTADMGFPYESSTYLDLPFILLEHRETSNIDIAAQRIGVAKYYCTDSYMENGTLYGREVVKYATVQELQQAFDADEIDCMLITVISLNMIRDDFETQDYIATTVEDTLQLSLAFSEHLSAQEITVFNKLISTVDQSILESAALEYTFSPQDISLLDIIETKPWILINSALLILSVIFTTSMFFLTKQRREITAMINVDSVTGIRTEYKFKEDVRKILENNPTKQYSLMVLDIDNFKYINEIYGYEIGTELLKILARSMDRRSAEDTLVARGDADRFMAMAPITEYAQSVSWIHEDMDYAHNALQQLIGSAYKLYFSMGLYEINHRDLDITLMLDYANIARQQGKMRAGNSISVFTPQMQQNIANNNFFTSIMEQALEDNEFVLHYQPKISLQTGAIAGAEALIRWQRASEYLPPYQFIPLFEKNGFIEEMDYYVLEKVCVFLRTHPSILKGRISVNLSGVTMLQDSVVQRIMDVVTKHQISPSQLDLELTETAFVNSTDVLESVRQLRIHGFTISMDDFGTGVSSLNRLKNMDIDTLKIDREFIIDSIENPRGNQILHSVVDMVKKLNLETVAEGVETDEQRIFLKNLGCDLGQGYFFARPLPEADFIAYCKEHGGEATI